MQRKEAEEFPADVEELFGFLLRHVASELKVAECPAPLEQSLRIFTRAAIQADRNLHEHPTPLIEVHDHDVTVIDADGKQAGNNRPTLPTEPPVDYSDPPVTGRRSRGVARTK